MCLSISLSILVGIKWSLVPDPFLRAVVFHGLWFQVLSQAVGSCGQAGDLSCNDIYMSFVYIYNKVQVMALLSGAYDCSMQKFLYIHHETPECSMEVRCRTEKGIPYGSNATLCLVKWKEYIKKFRLFLFFTITSILYITRKSSWSWNYSWTVTFYVLAEMRHC